jgi:predicted nucleic acid-binding protein
VPDARSRRRAAELGERHKLSYYDAVFAATAQVRGFPLVTADRRLLDTGLGESPAALVRRLGG